MRFILPAMLLFASIFSPMGQAAAEEAPSLSPGEIHGESAILIDGTTGTILFEKNADVPLYPASITKIATGIYAIEKGNPEDIVTVSRNARYVEGTRVYLGEGEQVSLKKLEYGLLMHSGNDAAIAIAEHLAGSVEQFAEELNHFLAERVELSNTHFTNPHGLHDPDHYTTAADMAKIAQYAMKNPVFREIVATNRLPWDGREWKSELINHNKMLRNYEGATGIKNGFTDQARHTLVASAKRGNTEFIAVTMKAQSSNYAYQDVTKLLDYGFAHFETRQIAQQGDQFSVEGNTGDTPQYYTDANLFVTAPLGAELKQEVTLGGNLLVQAGDKSFFFQLKQKEVPKPPAAVAAQSANPPLEEDTPSVARYVLFFAWMLFNALLVFYVAVRVRRRKRERQQMTQSYYRRSVS